MSDERDSCESVPPEFDEKTKRLLDEINAAISEYDPILKEQARDILLKSIFGWEAQNNEKLADASAAKDREAFTKATVTLKDYSEKWQPRTACDRALLSLYYLKRALGLRSATGRQIKKELEHNGMNVTNISVAMHENVRLMRAQSRVIRGTKGTRQSRNDYAITDFGIQYIESRFNLEYPNSR